MVNGQLYYLGEWSDKREAPLSSPLARAEDNLKSASSTVLEGQVKKISFLTLVFAFAATGRALHALARTDEPDGSPRSRAQGLRTTKRLCQFVFFALAFLPLTSAAQSAIPQTGWKLAYVDSQETSCGSYGGANAFDGKAATFWHTTFCGGPNPNLPHDIQINLGAAYSLTGFSYLPRQDGCSNGWISKYEFYVSADGVNWGTAVAAGTFNYGAANVGCSGSPTAVPAIVVSFPPATGSFVRLRALSEINGNQWSSMAELKVIGAAVTPTTLVRAKFSFDDGTAVAGSMSVAQIPPGLTPVALGNFPLDSTGLVSASLTLDPLSQYHAQLLNPSGTVIQEVWTIETSAQVAAAAIATLPNLRLDIVLFKATGAVKSVQLVPAS